jgi:hypothetical protein
MPAALGYQRHFGTGAQKERKVKERKMELIKIVVQAGSRSKDRGVIVMSDIQNSLVVVLNSWERL